MRKFLKYLLVFVLVLASIGGTCYFFFRTLTKRKDSEAAITNYLYSSEKVEFDSNVARFQAETNSRFDSLIKTKSNLDDILSTFSTYLVEAKNYDVNENGIIERLNDYLSEQSEVDEMIDSFMVRLSNANFNKVTGANEIYLHFAKMNVIYADLLNYINNEFNNMPIVKDSDIKFSMINLYSNVVISTLENINTSGSEFKIKDETNLTLMNAHFKLENSVLITSSTTTNFASVNNNFIKYYNLIDASDFAKNLASNINSVSGYADDLTNVQKTSYYFKQVYGI